MPHEQTSTLEATAACNTPASPNPDVEEFHTPTPAFTVHNNPLPAMSAPRIPESFPIFRGEKGRDNLTDRLAQAKIWFARAAIVCKHYVSDEDLLHIFCLQAFPQESLAQHWYEASQAALLTPVPAPQAENTFCTHCR